MSNGVSLEFSAVDYSITGDDHWTATCEDDLTGDGNSDWVSDYSLLPGGATDVVRVRMIWDRKWNDLVDLAYDKSSISARLITSFNLKIKETVSVGSYLPNTAAIYDNTAFGLNAEWRGTTTAET